MFNIKKTTNCLTDSLDSISCWISMKLAPLNTKKTD